MTFSLKYVMINMFMGKNSFADRASKMPVTFYVKLAERRRGHENDFASSTFRAGMEWHLSQ